MKEALKLALEALERYQIKRQDFDTFVDVITAIKEALAQDELCSSQEPDAFDDDIEVLGHNEIRTRYRLEKGTKLYTSPPKRPWVGLTDEQREACTQSPFTEDNYEDIEAKLKELNT